MAMVGNNLGQNFLAAAQPAAKSLRSSPLSSSSSDFAKIFNQKESREDKTAGERAELPRAPGKDLSSNLPNRWNGQEINQKIAVKEAGYQDSSRIQMKAESQEGDEVVDNLAHRQALQQLLKRMKDEFNLDAEQIVEAFAQLSSEELQQPPEATLDRIIQGLPLNPEQQAAAKAIFQDMLKQTAADGMADYLTASRRQLSLEVVSKNQAQKRATALGVEQMQNNFFVEPPAKMAIPAQAGLTRYKNQQEDSANNGTLAMAAAAAAGLGTMAASASQNTSASVASGAAASSQPQVGMDLKSNESTGSVNWQELGLEQVKSEAPPAVGAPVPNQQKPSVKPSFFDTNMTPPQNAVGEAVVPNESKIGLSQLNQDQSGLMAEQMAPQASVTTTPSSVKAISTAPSVPASEINLSVAGLMEVDASSSDSQGANAEDEMRQDGGSDLQNFNVQQVGKNSNESAVKGPDSFVIPTQPTENQEANNIRQVVNQAQVLARKGGGEMKMILSPEGLGQLTMKVNVQNGHVNVEMVADSNEAKKIIEKGLGELKATLITHNLKVDQIKVDTPADVSKQMNMQHEEGQRQSAQQFMEQFRQDNNEWRRGFFDIGGAKMYRSQKEEVESGRLPQPENRRRAASTRRLDLVA